MKDRVGGSPVNDIPQSDAPVLSLKNAAELALDLYRLLSPYPSDLRQRAIQSALTAMGETPLPAVQGGFVPPALPGAGLADFSDVKLGPKASKWIQKHGISRALLDEVFHISGDDFDVTAAGVPGSSKREMTVNCYLLEGLRGLLKNDVPTLNDSDAIALCKRLATYDKNNHPTYRQAVGNKMTGTKPTFTLTGPGEIAVAELVKQMVTKIN
jgi:hypothetical protein